MYFLRIFLHTIFRVEDVFDLMVWTLKNEPFKHTLPSSP